MILKVLQQKSSNYAIGTHQGAYQNIGVDYYFHGWDSVKILLAFSNS